MCITYVCVCVCFTCVCICACLCFCVRACSYVFVSSSHSFIHTHNQSHEQTNCTTSLAKLFFTVRSLDQCIKKGGRWREGVNITILACRWGEITKIDWTKIIKWRKGWARSDETVLVKRKRMSDLSNTNRRHTWRFFIRIRQLSLSWCNDCHFKYQRDFNGQGDLQTVLPKALSFLSRHVLRLSRYNK